MRRLGSWVLLVRSSVHEEGRRSGERIASATAVQSDLGTSHEPVALLSYLTGSLSGTVVSIEARVRVKRRHHHAADDRVLLLLAAVTPNERLIVSE